MHRVLQLGCCSLTHHQRLFLLHIDYIHFSDWNYLDIAHSIDKLNKRSQVGNRRTILCMLFNLTVQFVYVLNFQVEWNLISINP